jgi:signal transduction histidine kinase
MPQRDDIGAGELAERVAIAKMFAHDFKNPISALSANLSYLQAVMTEAEEDARGAVDDSVFALGVLLHLVDNYVALARLEAGERVEPSSVPLRQFVETTLRACRGLLSNAEVNLRCEGAVPDVVCEWELAYASLVLKNLLVGSAAYAAGGGEVALRVLADEKCVTFSVTDTGPLVDEQLREDLFSRGLQCRAKSLPGARYARGFGLYAVGCGARALGGSASVGARGERPEFVVVIPIDPGA